MTASSSSSLRNDTAGCGCGACQGSIHRPQEAATYLRPKFFPGQLLTEDDLGQMVSYMTAKSRLHNRLLFGAGVVAGLEVRPHPEARLSEQGWVRVEAGYALDSQGNDIAVPSRQDFSLAPMVTALIQSRSGVECPPSSAYVGTPSDTDTDAVRDYGLYLRYTEEPTEPVAPYTVGDDPCAAQSCQFSRIREGFVFELRCYEEKPGPGGLVDVLEKQCGATPDEPDWSEDGQVVAPVLRQLDRLIGRAPRECMCSALLPPCTHTKERSVLLARVSLRRMKIEKICNMVRQLVLSPAAVQYWMGGPLRELFEALCCDGGGGGERMHPREKRKEPAPPGEPPPSGEAHPAGRASHRTKPGGGGRRG